MFHDIKSNATVFVPNLISLDCVPTVMIIKNTVVLNANSCSLQNGNH